MREKGRKGEAKTRMVKISFRLILQLFRLVTISVFTLQYPFWLASNQIYSAVNLFQFNNLKQFNGSRKKKKNGNGSFFYSLERCITINYVCLV